MWLTAKVLDVMKNKLFLDCGLIHGQIQKPKVCWGLYRHMWPIMWKNEMPWNTHWWVYPKHIFFMILWDDPFILWKRNTSMKILGEITNVHEIHEFISKFTKSRKNTKTTKIARKYTNHENAKKRAPWKSVKRPWKKPPLASEIDAVSSLHSFLFFGWFFATMLNLYTGWLFHVLLRALYGGCVYIYIYFFFGGWPWPFKYSLSQHTLTSTYCIQSWI